MKKLYSLLLFSCICANLQNAAFGQSVLNPNDTIAEYDPGNPPAEPPYGQIGKWVRTKSVLWNSDSYKAYIYKGSCFRLKFPKSYNPDVNDGKKYPIALVFHGGGEAGPINDNETQLYHGGLEYMNAVDSSVYDGYVLFMQSQGFWGTSSYAKVIDIINYMITNNKLNPFKISVNGLSSGGQASWEMIINYPNYVSASLPMSDVSIGYKDPSVVNKVKFTPMWNFQGGIDGSPGASTAQQVRDAIVAAGGNYRYSEYPNIGHDTWDPAFSEADFFPFMARAYSSNPWPLFGRTGFCNGDVINLTLGLAPGFNGYQWRKDSVVISGATTNTLNVTALGTYDARVLRGSIWSDWSPVPVRVQITPPTVTPPITVSGLMSNVLTSVDGKNFVTLEVPDNSYTSYAWRKVGNDSILGNQRTYTATQTGKYTAAVTEKYGCSSIPSPPFSVINAAGQNPPDAVTNLFANAISSTKIALNWENKLLPVYNETFFEIYRSTSPYGVYNFIGKVPADTLHYSDNQLSPGGNYFYKIRAVNDSGAASISNVASVSTKADKTPPTAPGNLQVMYATNSSISIQWDSSTDNVGVKFYQIYINGIKSYITSSNSFIVNGLEHGKIYSFYVKAIDSTGNYSPQSNIASSPANLNGLIYKYYEGYWLNMPDFNTLTPIVTGVSPNVNINLNKRQSQFGFLWQGYINIPATGTYKFEAASDDGSKIWINTYDLSQPALVDNDGLHHLKRKTAKITLQKGIYPISIGYFQVKQSKVLKLSWSNSKFFGDTLKHEIEDKYFTSDYTPADSAPAAPSNISAANISPGKIKITWLDNSINEKGFQIYRSLNMNNGYSIIFTTASNISGYIDSGLTSFTRYFYKINAVNDFGTSAFTDSVLVQTLNLSSLKAAGNLKAKPLSSSSIQLTWNDLDTTEDNYEVFRSVSDSINFKLAAVLSANSTGFTDTALYPHTNYFYKVNTINAESSSPDKFALASQTKNTVPLINNKFNVRRIHYDLQTTIPITASDSDGDAISFSAAGLPGFAQFTDNGKGTASLVFNPSILQKGTYDGIKIFAQDDFGGLDSDVFKIAVGDNYTPVINNIPNDTVDEGNILSVQLTANDQNPEDSLTWSIIGAPNGYSLVPVSNGVINLILSPNYTSAGVYKIQAIVDDAKSGVSIRQFNLTVNDKDPNLAVYIRFKDQDAVGLPWNDITSVNSSTFKDNLNRAANIGLTLQTSWWATWHVGPSTGNNSGIYPDNVLKDCYYFGTNGGPQTVTGTITGLDSSKQYNISFYGGSNWSGATDNGSTVYTIGAQSIPLHVQNNTANTANFSKVKSALDGTLSFTMSKAVNTPVGYVNAIVITSLYSDSLKPAAPASLVATSLTGKGIQLSWKDLSYNEANYNVYRSLNAAGPFVLINGNLPFNTVNYIDSNTLGSTSYFYMVKASNAIGVSDSSNIANAVTADRVPVIQPISSFTIKNNQQQTINVVALDDANDHITLTAENLPAFVTFTDNGNGTGIFTVIPVAGITGTFQNITVKATDNSDSSNSVSFNITVTDQSLNSVYINFSNGSLASSPWNNLTAWPVANTTLSNLYDDNSTLTTVSLKLLNGFQGNFAGGMQPGNNRGVYSETVMRTGEYEGSLRTDSILISGLDKSKKYNFIFFNSHDDGLKGNTNFAINNQTVNLNATHNINTTAQINGILADANGQVFIKVSKASGADYAYINSLIIQSYDSTTTLLAPNDLRAVSITSKSITLQWADRSWDESGFEIWRATDSVSSSYALLKSINANITSYIDSNLNPGHTYYYIVRAIKTGSQSNFCSAIAATTYSQVVYVNFTFVNNANVPWNNTDALPQLGSQWSNFYDNTGIPSSISMQETGVFAGVYNAGMNTGNNSGIYPDKVLADSYVLFPGQSATMKITGLNLNMKYDFTFFGSSQAFGDVNSAYIINGKKVILNASLNINGTVTLYNVIPDKNGEVVITIAPNSVSSQYGMISALVIQEYNTSANIPLVPQSFASNKIYSGNFQSVHSAITNKIENKTSVYPNPFNQYFMVSLSLVKEDDVEAYLYDINGKLIFHKNLGRLQQGLNNLKIIPTQNIPSGVYILKIMYTNSKVINNIKILKQE